MRNMPQPVRRRHRRKKHAQKLAERNAHRRNRPRLDHQKQRPPKQKTPQRPQRFSQIDILSAGLRHHRRQLAITERPNQRQHSRHNPRTQKQRRRSHAPRNVSIHNVDARPNHRSDDDRGSTEQPKALLQPGTNARRSLLGSKPRTVTGVHKVSLEPRFVSEVRLLSMSRDIWSCHCKIFTRFKRPCLQISSEPLLPPQFAPQPPQTNSAQDGKPQLEPTVILSEDWRAFCANRSRRTCGSFSLTREKSPVPHSSQPHRDEWDRPTQNSLSSRSLKQTVILSEDWRVFCANYSRRTCGCFSLIPRIAPCPIHRSLIAMSGADQHKTAPPSRSLKQTVILSEDWRVFCANRSRRICGCFSLTREKSPVPHSSQPHRDEWDKPTQNRLSS